MNTARLEAFVFDKMAATRLPALSLALVQAGRVVYARGFGQRDLGRGLPATPETLYGAASITKSFVAVALLQLAEQGLLRLTDPVDRYLDTPFPAPRGPVTIEHLLAHTSGLPALGYVEAVLRHAHGIGGTHLPIGGPRDLPAFLQGAESWAEAAPGERWAYLNEGYALLGQVLERVAKQPYDQYIREHILRPLGMSRSFFAEAEVVADAQAAVPYVLPQHAPPRAGRYLYNVITTDGGLVSSVLDLARYVTMFLNRGRGVLGEDSFENLIRPRVAIPGASNPALFGDRESEPRAMQYALGLHVQTDFLGQTLIGHAGNVLVATGYIGFMPAANAGVAVLTNGAGYPMPNLARVALAVLFGHDPQVLPFVRLEQTLGELIGCYETHRGTVRARVLRQGDFLRIEYLGGEQPPPAVTLVPECLKGPEFRFFTYGDGLRYEVVFRRTETALELVHERYKLRRSGPLPKEV